MRGGRELRLIEQALRRMPGAFPPERLSVAEDVLLALAGQYYTVSELARIVGRDRMIQSSLYTEGRAEGRVEGRVEGGVEGERELCVALAHKHHPAVFDLAKSIIETCPDPDRLKKWARSRPPT
jgi:hypothetical protein